MKKKVKARMGDKVLWVLNGTGRKPKQKTVCIEEMCGGSRYQIREQWKEDVPIEERKESTKHLPLLQMLASVLPSFSFTDVN